jgi:hypothetical protein
MNGWHACEVRTRARTYVLMNLNERALTVLVYNERVDPVDEIKFASCDG